MGPVPATACRPVDFFTLYELAGTELASARLFQAFGILPATSACEKCGCFIPGVSGREGSMVVWKCRNRACRCARTVRSGSLFLSNDDNRNRLQLRHIAVMIYGWSMRLTLPFASGLTSCSASSVSKFYNLFRDVCFEALVLHELENGPDPFIASITAPDKPQPPLKRPRNETDSHDSNESQTDFGFIDGETGIASTLISSSANDSALWRLYADKFKQYSRVDIKRMKNNTNNWRNLGTNLPRYVAEEWWRARHALSPGYPGKALFEEFLKLVGRSKVYGCTPIVQIYGPANEFDHGRTHSFQSDDIQNDCVGVLAHS